jgi:IS5 family transposase
MIQFRHQQPTLWAGFLAEEVQDLWEPWMRHADQILADEELIGLVYEAQAARHSNSRTFGRPQTPAEVVLRLLLLKHIRNWSFDELEREVRANLVYRSFTRIGTEKVPDSKTLARLCREIDPDVIGALHERMIELARQEKVVQGRKLRVDTTVVETNVHYPTDSSLLGDGARVLTRTMKQIEKKAGKLKHKVRDRMRAVRKRVIAIALASRQKGPQGEEARKKQYRELLAVSRRIVNEAKGVAEQIRRRRLRPITKLRQQLEDVSGRVEQVIRQATARIFEGNTKLPDKVVSLFEPHTEIIRKGKASKPTEFGKMVQIQEAENQIITHYEVFDRKPADSELLVPAVNEHVRKLGRVPRLVAADAGFYTKNNEKSVEDMGVKFISVPNRQMRSAERRKLQKQRWFKQGQRWRTGCEGRISVLKRRHGLNRCRYRGMAGIRRWVGLGVIADNLLHIGRCLALHNS